MNQPYSLLSYVSVVVCLRCLLHHILSLVAYTFRENEILFSLLLCGLWLVQIVGYVLVCRSCSFVCTVHYTIIIIVQSFLKTLNLNNACQISFVECVSLSYPLYNIWDCVFSVYPFPLWWLREYTLYYHHQIGSMNYYPLFRVRSWNNGMRCMYLYILTKVIIRMWSLVFWCH